MKKFKKTKMKEGYCYVCGRKVKGHGYMCEQCRKDSEEKGAV